ncbi:DNA -binding domain-containing protein [Azorhizobium doebereinerae]|uniref:DNA -binding domain-containing protein n=1 Tax=Azorhizobium doebereinerae TaxID=281091 RepID=UPI00048D9914|nr:DUF2285 domain-containing protein [Azorhizobium doebereinerae]
MTEFFEDIAPFSLELTGYDRAHIRLYARLMDAVADGADWKEIVVVLFGLDAAHEPERARNIFDSHLARARWVAASGYKDLLRTRDD